MRRHRGLCLLVAWLAMPNPAAATFPEDLPASAVETQTSEDPPGRYGVARGVWTQDGLPFEELTGTRARRAYRLADSPGVLNDALATLTEAYEDEGYEILLSCRDLACGGFDFRQRLAVLPLPAMYVDLGSFRYLSARRGSGDETELISVLASRSGGYVHLQIDHITALASRPPVEAPDADVPDPLPPTAQADQPLSLVEAFARQGQAVLEGLAFDSGTSSLSPGPYAALGALAAYLRDNPDARIVLVGHTDSTGSLAANITVSERRAASVADYLVSQHRIARDRLFVEGIGYLAPRADNRSAAGRTLNRRVTAVLLP